MRDRWVVATILLAAAGLALLWLLDRWGVRAGVIVVVLGLVAIGVGYSIWAALNHKHWREIGLFMRALITPAIALLAIFGFSLVLQGLGDITGWEALLFVGRAIAELFGGS